MKKLIVNADDFGSSKNVNEAIIKCYTRGTVTDMSLLATGDAFSDAIKLAKENSITKIGVHLAFPESYKIFFLKYFAGFIKKDKIYGEFKQQISKVKKEGFKVTHLDSHEHIHMIPGILKIVLRLMKEEGIDCVRFPLERLDAIAKLKDLYGWFRNIQLSSVCNVSKRLLNKSGIKHNDYFIGHARVLRLRKKDFIDAISNLKDGLTELSCHPGGSKNEFNTLCDNDFIKAINEYSIKLVDWQTG